MIRKITVLLFLFTSAIHVRSQINTASPQIPFGSNMSYHETSTLPTNLPQTGAYGHAQDAANAYNFWKQQFVEICGSTGRTRVKFDNSAETVSEGIAYGMLLASYAGDKTLFDGLWNYYKHYRNNRGLMHWKIAGCGSNLGVNGATDADLDAAMALIVANKQWPSSSYHSHALTLITDIKDHEIHGSPSYQTSNGDGWLLGNSTCRNPSYQSPGYYKMFGLFTGQRSYWNAVTNASYTLLNNNVHPTTGLVTNWCNPSGAPNDCNNLGISVTQYGFDACRNPWRMAADVIWFDGVNSMAICNNIAGYIENIISTNGVFAVKGPIEYDGSGVGLYHNATFVSTWAAGLVGSDQVNQNTVNLMYDRTKLVEPNANYYGSTLRVLSLFMMTGNFWNPFDQCPLNESLTGAANSNMNYQVSNRIESQQQISSDLLINLRAGKEIELNENFSVDTGTTFMAKTESCRNAWQGIIPFNGTTHYLDGFSMSTALNGRQGTLAMLIDFTTNASSTEYISCSNGYAFRFYRTAAGNLQMIGENSSGTIILNTSTSSAPCDKAGLYYIITSWNLAIPGSMKMVINGKFVPLNYSTFTSAGVDWSQTDYTIGATFAGSLKMQANLYMFLLDINNYIDLTIPANLNKYQDECGFPRFLGFYGENITGLLPEIYVYHTPQGWRYSKGSVNKSFIWH